MIAAALGHTAMHTLSFQVLEIPAGALAMLFARLGRAHAPALRELRVEHCDAVWDDGGLGDALADCLLGLTALTRLHVLVSSGHTCKKLSVASSERIATALVALTGLQHLHVRAATLAHTPTLPVLHGIAALTHLTGLMLDFSMGSAQFAAAEVAGVAKHTAARLWNLRELIIVVHWETREEAMSRTVPRHKAAYVAAKEALDRSVEPLTALRRLRLRYGGVFGCCRGAW